MSTGWNRNRAGTGSTGSLASCCAVVADSIGLALLVVLDTLTPAEARLARSRPRSGRRGGELRVVHAFTTGDDAITAIDLIADPERLRQIDLVIVDA